MIQNTKVSFLFGSCCIALLFSACKQQSEIEIYTVPKSVAYKLPSNWNPSSNTSSMRLATFEVKGANDEEAEVAILPMPDLKVEDHEIVNLWRQQLQLEPISAEEVEQLSEPVKIGDFDGRIFDLTAPESAPGEMAGMRIITAFVNAPNGTWFFKMTGSKAHLDTERDGFTSFLASVNLTKMQEQMKTSRQTTDPHAGMNMTGTGGQPSGSPTPATGSTAANLPEWTIPQGWTSTGPRSMILASFKASGNGGDVDVTVSRLGGAAGGLLPNINRWRGQVGLGPASEGDLAQIASEITAGPHQGTLVVLPGQENRIDAAIFAHEGQSWFFKAMGPKAAVQREAESFKSFVQSVQFNDHAE